MFENIDTSHKESIIELLEEIIEFYEEDNWLTVKKYILRYSHPDVRKYFSTRHHKTKKHTLNCFEESFICFCLNNYNLTLRLYEEDRHYETE